MLTFTVHEPPYPPADRSDRAERLVFVRDGFSWGATLLTPLWLLAHRMWLPLVGYIVVGGLIEAAGQSGLVHAGWAALAGVALNLLLGIEFGALRRWSLDRRGWATLGSVSGRSAEDCERRFFDLWLPTQPVLAQPAPAAAGDGGAAGRRSLIGALSGAPR
jgi:hypothetical protein